MTVEIIEPNSIEEGLSQLTALALEFPKREYVFRGQMASDWDLETSYQRYWQGQSIAGLGSIDNLVAQFRSGVKKLGTHPSLESNLDWLEYARHQGLPSPLLDFSWSPYVALFFAFNGVRIKNGNEPGKSAIFALDLTQLSKLVAAEAVPDMHLENFRYAREQFLHAGANEFKEGFPENSLLFLRYPNAFTQRMHVQQGVFLYSTLALENHDWSLLAYFDNLNEDTNSPNLGDNSDPVMRKYVFLHEWVKEAFSRLELLGMTGRTLYLSPEGVAQDAFNSFNYSPRAAYLRDEFGS